MNIQLIEDDKGNPTGVYIPINEWKRLKLKHKELAEIKKEEPSKDKLLQELKQAITELKMIEQGKLKARPAKELINEL